MLLDTTPGIQKLTWLTQKYEIRLSLTQDLILYNSVNLTVLWHLIGHYSATTLEGCAVLKPQRWIDYKVLTICVCSSVLSAHKSSINNLHGICKAWRQLLPLAPWMPNGWGTKAGDTGPDIDDEIRWFQKLHHVKK